jgi:hypothetical protein
MRMPSSAGMHLAEAPTAWHQGSRSRPLQFMKDCSLGRGQCKGFELKNAPCERLQGHSYWPK